MWNPASTGDDKYYGEPLLYDPEFKGAKVERRSTDLKCLMFFVVCFVVWLGIAIFAMVKGDLSIFISEIEIDTSVETIGGSYAETFVNDLSKTWPAIAVGLLFGMLACLVFVAVMRWIAAYVTWASIFILIIFLGAVAGFSVYAYAQSSGESSTPLLISMILAIILFVLITVVVFLCRRKIIMSIQLIKEGSKATNANIMVLFFPIFHSIVEVLVMAFALYVIVSLSSTGTPNYALSISSNSTSCNCNGASLLQGSICNPADFKRDCANTECGNIAACHLDFVDIPVYVQIFMAYSVFEFLWMAFFLTAFAEMVLAGVFGIWYWTFNKDNVPSNTFFSSFYRTVRYHLGTLAFGSLIITIIRIIRMIVSGIRDSLRNSNNVFAQFCFACLEFLIRSIENFLKMINKNAYILTAIHGTDFATSIKNAFNLIMRNVLSVIVLNNVTDLVFFIMQLLISLGATACFYTAMTGIYQSVIHVWELTLIYFIFMFFITVMFFSVFSMAVDTIFLCFLEDMERNDGSAERPYFMSAKLRDILQKQD